MDDPDDGAIALSQLQRSGGSVILTIPQAMVDRLGVAIGQKINLKAKGGVLIVEQYQMPQASSDQNTRVTTAPVAFAEEWGRLRAKFESSRKNGCRKS